MQLLEAIFVIASCCLFIWLLERTAKKIKNVPGWLEAVLLFVVVPASFIILALWLQWWLR